MGENVYSYIRGNGLVSYFDGTNVGIYTSNLHGDVSQIIAYGLNRISRRITGPEYADCDGSYSEVYFYDGHGNVVQLVNEKITDFICDYMEADFAQAKPPTV